MGSSGFLTTQNLTEHRAANGAVNGLAVGLVFVLAAGEIDLSFGATVALAAIVAAIVMRDQPWPSGCWPGSAPGMAAGAGERRLVAYGRLPSFLVTLATYGRYRRGRAFDQSICNPFLSQDSASLAFFGGGSLCGIPSLVFWTVAAMVIGHLSFVDTRFGAHVLAIGDNPRAAALVSGIRVARLAAFGLVLSGACAGLAGLLYAGRLQAARYTLGESDLMTVIAAVIVGGTALNGGKGTIFGRAGRRR